MGVRRKVDDRFENWVKTVLNPKKGFRNQCIAWGCLKMYYRSQLKDQRLCGCDRMLVQILQGVINEPREDLGERVAALVLYRDEFPKKLTGRSLNKLQTMIFERCLSEAEDQELSFDDRAVALGFIERCFNSLNGDARVVKARRKITRLRTQVKAAKLGQLVDHKAES